VVFIYWGMIFFAGISAASDDNSLLSPTSNAGMSPFAIALKNAGWSHGPDLINVFIFTATFSAINSSIYISSRTLYALADLGRAPKFLLWTPFRGVPVWSAVVSNLVGLLALINIASGAGKVFSYIISLSGAATFIAWACIGITHLRFRRAWHLQGNTAADLPFKSLWYPYGAYFVTFLNLFLLLIQGYENFITPWKPVDFVFSYIVIVLFVVLLVGWKLWHRTKLVNLAEVDLSYGRRTYLGGADEREEEASVFTRVARSVGNRFRS
jgi:yeast amino acid transporter